MKQIHSWNLPDYDTHYAEWMHNNREENYQRKQREFALSKVREFRRAIDIGGNIGFWSRDFCERFGDVQIFEPDRSNLECLTANLEAYKNFTIHEVGLGKEKAVKEFYTSPTGSGAHSFYKDQIFEEGVGTTTCEVHVLDDYNFTDIDLIKIDTQGSEYNILQGAKQTLITNNPILNIEIEHKNEQQKIVGKQIISFLNELGYKEIGRSRRKEVVFSK